MSTFDNAVRKKCLETTTQRRTALMEKTRTPEIRMKFGLKPLTTEKTKQQVMGMEMPQTQSIGASLPTLFGTRVYALSGSQSSMSMFSTDSSERGESDLISLSSFGSGNTNRAYWLEPRFEFDPDDFDGRSVESFEDENLRIGAEDRLIAESPNLAAIEARYIDEGGVGMRRRTALWAIDQSEQLSREFLRVPQSPYVGEPRGQDREIGRVPEQAVSDGVAINQSQMGTRM